MLTEGKARIYRFLQPFAKVLAWVLFRPKVVGTEHIPQEGGVLIVANHPTYLDPILLAIFAPRPFSFIATKRVFSIPFIRTFLWLTDCVPIEQDAPDRRALRLSIRKLRDGDALVVFPEGTRSDHGRLRPFQLGPALIALEAQVPVVPCGLAGVYDAWHMDAPFFRPAPVTIVFGEPMTVTPLPDAPTRKTLQQATEQMRRKIIKLITVGEKLLRR